MDYKLTSLQLTYFKHAEHIKSVSNIFLADKVFALEDWKEVNLYNQFCKSFVGNSCLRYESKT